MPHRKAARVFPEPVGAEIRTCSPDAIAGQAWICAGVAAANVVRNQCCVAGLNWSSGSHPAAGVGCAVRCATNGQRTEG